MPDILFPQDTSAKATPTTSDLILLADVADSNNPKDATLGSLPISTATQTALNGKQDTLVSGTNIKTINGNSVLGSGDLTITASANIPVKDEGTTITSAVSSINFVGSGVTATNVGNDVTVTISSGGGSGDVVGPASATDNAIARFDTTTGKLIQNSAATIADTTGDITAGKYNTVTISGTSTPSLSVTGTTSVSGTNTGDQTTIVGITGTMAQFNTAVTDGDIVYQSQALGTPSSGTLTNCTGLPVSGITSSTTQALGVGSLEIGNASDTTLSRSSAGVLAVEGIIVPTVSSTSTLTNKRITKRVTSNTPGTSPFQVDVSTTDTQEITGLSINLQFQNPTGTPTNGQLFMIRMKDNGTSRTITWDTQFASGAATLPTATTASKWTWALFEWVSADTKWYCISAGTQP